MATVPDNVDASVDVTAVTVGIFNVDPTKVGQCVPQNVHVLSEFEISMYQSANLDQKQKWMKQQSRSVLL